MKGSAFNSHQRVRDNGELDGIAEHHRNIVYALPAPIIHLRGIGFGARGREKDGLGWIPASNSEQGDGAGTAGETAGGML